MPQGIVLTAGQEQAAQPVILAARRYAAFWNTGEERHAEAALAQSLRAEIEQLLVVNDRAIVRYTFVGHFTGTFKDVKGDGRAISFRAVDIYRVQNGKISDNWHLEDNLSFMQQLGVVKP